VTAPYDDVREHYEAHWGPALAELRLHRGPMISFDPHFDILVFGPTGTRGVWTYATCGMSAGPARPMLEAHMFATTRFDDPCVELLTFLAFFHHTGEALGLHHTVAFGQPWSSGSLLDHGLLSLPYLDGPSLEWQDVGAEKIQHLWLLPISRSERELKVTAGVEALEALFESRGVAYADPTRDTLV
jgi:hypothetical protein